MSAAYPRRGRLKGKKDIRPCADARRNRAEDSRYTSCEPELRPVRGNKGRATRTTLQPGTNHKATPGHFVCRHSPEKSHAKQVERRINTNGDLAKLRPLSHKGLPPHRVDQTGHNNGEK